MNAQHEQWTQWLAEFKRRFIEVHKWTEKEAKLRLRDGWVCIRDGRIQHIFDNDKPPADAVPVFCVLTPGGRKLPIEITDRLTGLVGKALTSQRPPRDIVLGLLSKVEHADVPDEDDEVKQKRQTAAFWIWQLLDACEDKALAGVIGGDVFWQAVLYALQAGCWFTILDLYRDPQLLAAQIKAQSFQSGRSPDELTRRLEASYLELRAERGQDPKPGEVAKAAGGRWSDLEACWQFDGIKGAPPVSHGALRDRLKDIRRRHP